MKFVINSPKYGTHVVIIDDADKAQVLQHTWHVQINSRRKAVYAGTHIDGRTITLQKFLTSYNQTDHVNGNGLDCRRRNMREATKTQNMCNRGKQKNNSSGFKGVTFHKTTKKWTAQIWAEGQKKYLGEYFSKKQAALAYNDAALKFHGEFASLNEVP